MKYILSSFFVLLISVAVSLGADFEPSTTDQGSAVVTTSNKRSATDQRISIVPFLVTDLNIKVTAQFGPIKSSPDFLSFASDTVESIRTNILGGSHQLKNTLLPSHVTGFPVTNTIWFAVEVSSEQAFYPTDLMVQITSSPNNLFGKTTILNDPTFGYASTSVGEVWSANGQTNIIRSGRWNNQAVNHFVFLGEGSKTLNANSESEAQSNSNWLLSFTNFTITTTWTVNGTSATKTLQTRPYSSLVGKLRILNKTTLSLPQFTGLGEVWGTPDLNTPFTHFGYYESGSEVTISPENPRYFFKLSLD